MHISIDLDGDFKGTKEQADEFVRVLLSKMYDETVSEIDQIAGSAIVIDEKANLVSDLAMNSDGWIQDWSELNGSKESSQS